MTEEPRNVLVAKELDADLKDQLPNVLLVYKDVFAWSYEDMKGLHLEFYHHKINLVKDAIPVQPLRDAILVQSKSRGGHRSSCTDRHQRDRKRV
jgi:hypothetical protein